MENQHGISFTSVDDRFEKCYDKSAGGSRKPGRSNLHACAQAAGDPMEKGARHLL